MVARIVSMASDTLTVQVQIPFGRSLLESEELIQQALNEAGTVATAQALERFDTDGSPIEVGAMKFTSRGRLPKTYQTPMAKRAWTDTFIKAPRAARPIVPWR